MKMAMGLMVALSVVFQAQAAQAVTCSGKSQGFVESFRVSNRIPERGEALAFTIAVDGGSGGSTGFSCSVQKRSLRSFTCVDEEPSYLGVMTFTLSGGKITKAHLVSSGCGMGCAHENVHFTCR
jgi:hypothetical protein